MASCASSSGEGSFQCRRCGTCCTNLRGRRRGDGSPSRAIADGLAYQLPTRGGLRVFCWEAGPFPKDGLTPFIVVADRARDRQLVLTYELEADVCPKYATDEQACTIYEDRPLVCRAFPLLVSGGEEGLAVSAASLCGARIRLDQLEADESDEPREARLARAYPSAFAPALAVPAIVEHLVGRITFLAQADVIEPAVDLDPDEAQAFGVKPAIGLHEVLEKAGIGDVHELEGRAGQIREKIRERWGASTSP